jgi:hypothetical protein
VLSTTEGVRSQQLNSQCSFPGGDTILVPSPEERRGKVALPRNEAETDGAGTHQPNLCARGLRSPSASTQSRLGTSPVRLRKLRLRGRSKDGELRLLRRSKNEP